MARPIWKGHISFGLVNVPVVVYPAEQRADISFRLIDSRNAARIRYERINEETGEEVPWDKIVKGYEYDGGNYVLFSEDELAGASAEMTRTIQIEQFVDLDLIDAVFFDRPYYLVPDKGGEKGYVLLREAMASTGKVGVARVVIRAREYLAALIPQEDALLLELLRFQQELRPRDEFEFPHGDLKKYKVTRKEIEMAGQLVKGMAAKWKPGDFHDEYRDVIMKLIEKKIESGDTEVIAPVADDEEEAPRTINFAAMLKKSVEQTSRGRKSKKATKPSRNGKRHARKKRAS